jgi:UDP-GlcNAc:undecaprenyl-phosphate GlcNAc-1-phosphate transferase
MPVIPSLADLIVVCVFTTLVTILAMAALRPVAFAIDLVDRPNERKRHVGEVPLIGGLAILLGMLVAFGLVPDYGLPNMVFISVCALLCILGMLDDRFDLSPWARLSVQTAATLAAMYGSGLLCTSLGAPFGGEVIRLEGIAANVITLVLLVGAINAFNMLDGMDGVAGAMAVVAFAFLGFEAYRNGFAGLVFIAAVGAGSVAGFLVFNIPAAYNRRIRAFMGDAGSTLLGYVLASLCLSITQTEGSTLSPVASLWFVAMPVYELLWTTIRRLSRGTSPFRPDREHFHHLLQDAGLTAGSAFVLYLIVAVIVAAAGVLLHDVLRVSDGLQFALFATTGVAVVTLMYQVAALKAFMPARLLRTESDSL